MMNCEELLQKIAETPTPWHAVKNIRATLEENGFSFRSPSDCSPETAGKRYTVRNGSALIAYRIPNNVDPATVAFRITASHGDSPCFRLKPNGSLRGAYARLNAEPYGGGIYATWTDCPLGLAGRLSVRKGAEISTELFSSERAVAVIPNVAPHLQSGSTGLDPKCDLIPLFGGSEADLKDFLAEESGIPKEDIVGWDLSLVIPERGKIFGAKNEFMISPRLDDLECAYTCLDGFLSADFPADVIPVYALFDNEETGSVSFSGAAGTFLKDTLARILPDPLVLQGALSRSFFVSADNAHALHPNHPELYDGENAPVLNGGVVVKYNAAQRYMSDGFSGAVFAEICRSAKVPVQVFANRSDKRGGSTLGNLSETQVPVRGVDIGAAQLAMHSARETAGCKDVEYLANAIKAFYSADFTISDDAVRRNG